MKQPHKILVTTDFSATSRAAIAPAVMLAQAFGAKVLLVFVGEPSATVGAFPGLDMVAFEKHQWDQAGQDLKRFADANFPKELEVERSVVFGIPHLEIVRLAQERRADMIVMATHGRGFMSHAFLGSTTDRVIRRAPCPVLVVREPDAAEQK